MNPDNNLPQDDNGVDQNQSGPQIQPYPPMQSMPVMPVMPTMPISQQSLPSSEFQQIQSKTGSTKRKLSKKHFILIISSVAVIIGLGFFLSLTRPNYGSAYRKADIANGYLSDFYSKSKEVSKLMATGTDEFANKLGQEKVFYEKFQKAYKEIGESTAISDKDIKEKYTAFKVQADLVYTKMNVYFETAIPLHEFAVKSRKLSSDAAWTDAQIDDLVSTLVLSKNYKLVDFGEKFATASKKLVKAANDYKLSKSSVDYLAYTQAKSSYSSVYSSANKLSDELGVMTSTDSTKLTNTWRDLTAVITTKYKESIKK